MLHNSFADRYFASVGPRLWNTLSAHLPKCDSLKQFKRSLKTYLFGVWNCVVLWRFCYRTSASSFTITDPVGCDYIVRWNYRTMIYEHLLSVKFLAFISVSFCRWLFLLHLNHCTLHPEKVDHQLTVIIIIIIKHLYSALKSNDAEPLVASGYDCQLITLSKPNSKFFHHQKEE